MKPLTAEKTKKTVPDFVSQQYYRIGLLCASRPRPVLFIAVLTVIYACWPLLSIPIYIGRPASHVETLNPQGQIVPKFNSSETTQEIPPWKAKEPKAYVQQIIVKSMVHPYRKEELIKTDAFRGPLASAFKLHLEDVSLFRHGSQDMDHLCLRTDGLAEKYRHWATKTNILPDYGCLILSPANLWQRDPRFFQFDENPISTVFNYQKGHSEGHSSLADLVFGLRQRDTGITKYPVRNRQRVITYAVTIAFAKYNPDFIEAFKAHLLNIYNVDDSDLNDNDVVHVFYSSTERSYAKWIPFVITILMLFFYVYFSCKRIEVVKSKLSFALTAIVTVVCSTSMSLGLSGVSLNMNSKISLVPYLVAFISLENILVITQSVISTQKHLDVRIRIAQGLSKEGWNITKNIFAEITILSFIFLLGAIEASALDFCHIAIMGLLSDFFMQIFFFVPILSLDMNQMELSDSIKKPRKMFQKPISGPGHIKKISNETSVMAPDITPYDEQVPKRVRLINFIAKNRIIQRMFLLCMVGWISVFIYNSSFLDHLIKTHQLEVFLPSAPKNVSQDATKTDRPLMAALGDLKNLSIQQDDPNQDMSKKNHLKKLLPVRTALDTWSRLPSTHWPMLFSLYNLSLQGQYVTLLPPIQLSIVIGTEGAKLLRHPKEAANAKTEQDHEQEHDIEGIDREEPMEGGPELSPLVPTTPNELFYAFVLCFPSLLFILYLVMVLYRCVCSRNYAEWRTSWNSPDFKTYEETTQIVRETVPIELDGHKHEIEALSNDGNIVVSLCLGGNLCVWDSYTGEQISQTDRSRAQKEDFSEEELHHKNPSFTINTNFSSMQIERQEANVPYDFQKFQKVPSLKNGKIKLADYELSNKNNSVWTMDCEDGLIILGCSNGTVEIWDTLSGQLKCSHDDGKKIGVTHLKLCGFKLVIARLSGHLEFFDIKVSSVNFQRQNSVPLSPANLGPTRRYHVRTGSGVSLDGCEIPQYTSNDNIRMEWVYSIRAHPQPLTCLDCQGGRILTGSHDHTLRVFRLEDHLAVYTLHGHCGPVTATFIDKEDHSSACSGSQDGLLCTWDLLSGACVYSIQAHDGALVSLTYSSNYIVSMGSDERLCVWEKLQGHLINCIILTGGPYCADLVMLTQNLLVTGRGNNLVLWDVRLPDPVKMVKMGHPDCSQGVKLLSHLDDAIVCSYGSKLRLVRFPHFNDKCD